MHAQINGATVPRRLTLLLGSVIFVLLIACVNVANLQLSAGLSRRREIGTRAALGAGRGRIIRQLLTESVMLAVLSGAGGLALAVGVLRVVTAFAPATIVRVDELSIDATVLLFSIALSLGTAALFGVLPALHLSRGADHNWSRASGRTMSGDPAGRRIRSSLVVSEFALAVVLLTGAGLLIRSLIAVRGVDAAFANRAAVTAHLRFQNTLPRARRAALYAEAMDRFGSLPGVRAAGGVSTMFWNGDETNFGLRDVEGRPAEAKETWTALTWATISGNYFQAAGIPLLRGRYFQVAIASDPSRS